VTGNTEVRRLFSGTPLRRIKWRRQGSAIHDAMPASGDLSVQHEKIGVCVPITTITKKKHQPSVLPTAEFVTNIRN
jgi:hypothetical protein